MFGNQVTITTFAHNTQQNILFIYTYISAFIH